MATEKQTEAKPQGTYVYCVMPTAIAAKESKGLGPPIDASAKLRTVRGDGLTALVSDAMRAQYDPSRANIGAHERVVREACAHGDGLPMRFGTVAKDDGAVQSFLREKHEVLEKAIEQLHGRVELALKVFWDTNAILREILSEDEELQAMREALRDQPEAETHDQRVELGRRVTEAMEQKRQAEAGRILERLGPKATELDEQGLMNDTMVLNAAFLVDEKKLDAFDDEVNAIGAEQQGRLTFKYAGPLPPYSFVKIVIPKAKQQG